MERQKLYCPPTGNHPQELPDYWRFENRVIRRDLQTLEDAELHAWGWDGPFYQPIAKRTIDNAEIGDEQKESLQNDPDYTLDEENNVWVSATYDYDPETHKVVWYSVGRKYVILPKDQDSREYEIPYKSSVTLPSELPPGAEIYKGSSRLRRQQPAVPQLPPVLWNQFKQSILASPGFNEYIGTILPSLPIVATSLPVAITSLEAGKYENFRMVWGVIKQNALPPAELVTSLVALAKECNVPQDFIAILEG